MYNIIFTISHCSDVRVEEACERLSAIVSPLLGHALTFAMTEPEDPDGDFVAGADCSITDAEIIQVLASALNETYCLVEATFEHESNETLQGYAKGNDWDSELIGPLEILHPLSHALLGLPVDKAPGPVPVPSGFSSKPTPYPHLRVVE